MDLVEENLLQRASETDPFTLERYRQFLRWLPTDAQNVLDVGCNTGRGGEMLKRERPELQIRGLDIVQQRLDRLPRSAYAETICGSATCMPIDADSQHAVMAGEFIEHLVPGDAQAFLFESFRVLAVGGVLMLTTPNPSDIKRRLRKRSILGGAHVSQHHSDVLCQQLRAAGFGTVWRRGSGKVTRWVGSRLPLPLYGSYLIVAHKF